MNSKNNILIVEDNLIIAADIKDRLESFGYNVCRVVTRGEDAIRSAIELKPDLVLMDIGLKGKLNGVETAEKLREYMTTPIIYLTGNSNLLRKFNITGPYINKPFNDSELKRVILSATHQNEKA